MKLRSSLPLGLAAALLVAACDASSINAPPAAESADVAASPASSSAVAPGGVTLETLKVSVSDARYGALTATTASGAECSGQVRVRAGHFGEQPQTLLPLVTANASGVARWTYSAPRVPRGIGTYSVTCTTPMLNGTTTGSFDIAFEPLKASSFRVHVTVDSPPLAQFNAEPSLVPLRDAALAKMRATLASEWKSATRGLGSLEVVDASPDITLYLVAARGTSVHRGYEDGSQDIVEYVSDDFGPQSVENTVATALHELGHIWCCYGDGTSEGHWLAKDRQAGLYGVDKYGLMTDPVTCLIFGAIVSCPNRFSDREMTALGFVSFPPPTIDACVSQALSLRSSIASLGTRLDALDAQIEQQQSTLASLKEQLDAIRARYPGALPPAVTAQYNSLVDQYNAVAAQERASVDQYNTLAAQARTQTTQINSLPCDAS